MAVSDAVRGERLVELARSAYAADTGGISEIERAFLAASTGPGPGYVPRDDGQSGAAVAGALIAWLFTDSAAREHLHPQGVRLTAANVEGMIDLTGARDRVSLRLTGCVIAAGIRLDGAELGAVDLSASKIGPLSAENARVFADFEIGGGDPGGMDSALSHPTDAAEHQTERNRVGAVLTGPVLLEGLEVRGDLSFAEARFAAPTRFDDKAACQVRLSHARVTGDLIFDDAEIHRLIHLDNARIGGDLRFARSVVHAAPITRALSGSPDLPAGRRESYFRLEAINLKGLQVEGSLFFEQAHIDERIRALNCTIRGDVDLKDVEFIAPDSGGEADTAENGLILTNSFVGEKLMLMNVTATDNTRLNFRFSRAKTFLMPPLQSKWPAPGNLDLYGFVYEEISHLVDRDRYVRDDPRLKYATLSSITQAWLERSQPQVAGESQRGDPVRFHPQPYARLATVLNAQGYRKESLDLLVEMERRTIEGVAARRPWLPRNLTRLGSWTLRATIEYGYRPLRVFWWMVWTVVIATLVFWMCYRHDLFSVTDPNVYLSDLYTTCAPDPRTGAPPPGCPIPALDPERMPPHRYVPFDAFLYAIDTFVPILDLGVDTAWAPNPNNCWNDKRPPHPERPLRPRDESRLAVCSGFEQGVGIPAGALLEYFVHVFFVPFGWLLSTLFFLGITGLTKSRNTDAA
ncbi:MAG: hypothetical protein GY791_19735 [Alphaproteobacteria bacterium]|nr:hypothetical protein [Alphaproteobacteria bacterium]